MKKRRTRGRRVLLWTAACFVLIQVAAGVLIDRYGLRIRFPDAAEKLAALDAEPQPPLIVAFGSSRMFGAFIDETIRDEMAALTRDPSVHAFNMAVPAGDLTTTDFLLDQVLRMGVRPRVAVIEISPELLQRHNRWMNFHARRQVTWENLPVYSREVWKSRQTERFLANHFWPVNAYRFFFAQEAKRLGEVGWGEWSRDYRLAWQLYATGPPEPTGDAGAPVSGVLQALSQGDGHSAEPVSFVSTGNGTPAAAKELNPAHVQASQRGIGEVSKWLAGYEAGGLNRDFLEKILRRCHEHGIVPLLVMTPVTKSHQVLYTAEIEAQFQACLAEVRKQHSFHFRDYRAGLPEHLFLDNHHHSAEGGKRFSAALAHELLAPVWRELRRGGR